MQCRLSFTIFLLASSCLGFVKTEQNDKPPKDYPIQVQVGHLFDSSGAPVVHIISASSQDSNIDEVPKFGTVIKFSMQHFAHPLS